MDGINREDKAKKKRAEGYIELVAGFGIATIADKLLAKWISDSDADEKWSRLAKDINSTPEHPEPIVACRPLPPAIITHITPQLSRREAIILTLLAGGWLIPAIASRLKLSNWTIQDATSKVGEKLGTNNPTESVARGIRSGQIKPPRRRKDETNHP